MGYTHFYYPVKTSQEQFDSFVEFCKKLADNIPKTTNSAGGYFENAPLIICGGDGTGEPTFDSTMVCFNGSDEGDLSHETFCVVNNSIEMEFCKTARKPYDLLVCACLIAAKRFLGYKIMSDGNTDDWQPAFDYYNSMFGTSLKFVDVVSER